MFELGFEDQNSKIIVLQVPAINLWIWNVQRAGKFGQCLRIFDVDVVGFKAFVLKGLDLVVVLRLADLMQKVV